MLQAGENKKQKTKSDGGGWVWKTKKLQAILVN